MKDELIRLYFEKQAEEMDDSFDTNSFLKRLNEEKSEKPATRGLYPSGLAVSLGLIILFSITLISEPMKGNEKQEKWEKNALQNIQIIEKAITERGKL